MIIRNPDGSRIGTSDEYESDAYFEDLKDRHFTELDSSRFTPNWLKNALIVAVVILLLFGLFADFGCNFLKVKY